MSETKRKISQLSQKVHVGTKKVEVLEGFFETRTLFLPELQKYLLKLNASFLYLSQSVTCQKYMYLVDETVSIDHLRPT